MKISQLFENRDPLDQVQDALWEKMLTVPSNHRERGAAWRDKAYAVAGLKLPKILITYEDLDKLGKLWRRRRVLTGKFRATDRAGWPMLIHEMVPVLGRTPELGTRVVHLANDGVGTIVHDFNNGNVVVAYDSSPNDNRAVFNTSRLQLWALSKILDELNYD